MIRKIIIGVILVIFGGLAGAGAVTLYGMRPAPEAGITPRPEVFPDSPSENQRAFSSIADAVSPAVVNISATRPARMGHDDYDNEEFFGLFDEFIDPPSGFGPESHPSEQSTGSGVVVSAKGYILTNYHVVSDAEKIRVTLFDKRAFKAVLIGADPKTDLAVLKVEATGLTAARWGNSDQLRVGEFVLAVGNPFGLNHTVTMGIISAVGRANVGIADYEDFIQTDAAINPGNSGGPLVSTEGELVGINTAIFSRSGGYQGIGFAVPSNMARLVMEQLMSSGKVVRGWLGISIQDLTPELALKFSHKGGSGALVSEIIAGSPAEQAGIRRGDIINSYAGEMIESPSELRNLVARSRPGDAAMLTVFRQGKEREVATAVGEIPVEAMQASAASASENQQGMEPMAGLTVTTLNEELARQLTVPRGTAGVVVLAVQEGSPASEAGLKRGDVIHEIEGARVRTIEEFQKAAAQGSQEVPMLIYLSRGGRKFYLAVGAS